MYLFMYIVASHVLSFIINNKLTSVIYIAIITEWLYISLT